MNDSKERIEKGKSMHNDELVKKCDEWIHSLAKSGGKSWVLSIPVRYHVDPDMLFTELISRFDSSQKEIAALKACIEKLLPLAEFLLNDTWDKHRLPDNTHGIIIEAKKLIEK